MTEEQVDVVVIGAGIAGLHVAAGATAAGLTTIVFEARDRVGGRLVATAPTDTRPSLDLGATWFWPGEARVAQLVDRLAVEVFAQHLDGDALFQAGPTAATPTQRLDGNPIDVPAGRFTGGAALLAERLAATLPATTIRTDEPVEGIEATPQQLHVSTTAGRVSAGHVVVAVPPALASARLTFTPALPDAIASLAAATPVWMGTTTKVVATFDRAFWREDGLAGAAFSHVGPLREIHDMSGPGGDPAALFGFAPAGGPGADQAIEADAVVDQLVALFGPRAAEPTAVHIRDWSAERWTSPPGVAALGDYRTYGHRLYGEAAFDGRLHWASTETATENPGHIEGALAAAERAVAAIMAGGAGTPHDPPNGAARPEPEGGQP